MIDDPGSFSGRESSPRPHRGPEARYRMSFAIFMKETAMVLRAPEASTMASWAARASNWGRKGEDTKGRSGEMVEREVEQEQVKVGMGKGGGAGT
jgi:hypothetical protein